MPLVGDYTAVAPGELRSFSIDFSAQLAAGETISSSTAAVSAYLGTDANAVALAYGNTVNAGGVVSQLVGVNGANNFQPGVIYRLTITAITSAGQKLINWAHLACAAIS